MTTERIPRRRVYMIGNAHLDPVWLWPWEEGWQEAVATFESALKLLDEFPAFVVTRGEAVLYQWIGESHPDLLDKVKQHVAARRWQVVNGWLVQSDCNLPHGEALIRQALLGKRWFRERFGIDVRTAYCVDSFGHAGTLPTILAGCGYDNYVMMRPQEKEHALPSNLFRWRGRDGSEVVTFRVSDGYVAIHPDFEAHLKRVLDATANDGPVTMCFYGVGNHGGGPTREQIEYILRRREQGDLDIVFGGPQQFFDEVAPRRGKLPVVAEELQMHATGCYSVVSAIKRGNRLAEAALLTAETMAALAWRQGVDEYPTAALARSWATLLFNQFHDILPGSSTLNAVNDAVRQLGAVEQDARHVGNRALRRLARRLDTTPPADGERCEICLVVFNPHGVEWRGMAEYAPWLDWWRRGTPAAMLAIGPDGLRLPVQYVYSDRAVGDRHTPRVVFPAQVGPLGYAVYRLVGVETQAAPEQSVRVEGLRMDNGKVAAEIDRASGQLWSLCCWGWELLAAPAYYEAVVDESDTWGHGVVRYDGAGERFVAEGGPVVMYRGPLRAEIRTAARWGEARLVQEFVLDADSDFLTVRAYLLWRGEKRLLRLVLPTRLEGAKSFAEAPHGWARRPADDRENVMQRWAALAADRAEGGGLTVANDGKYSYSAVGADLRITILRSPYHAYHDPHTPDPKRRFDVVDQGEQRYVLRLRPYRGAFSVLAAHDLAASLNQPPLISPETLHAGELGPSGTLLPLRLENARLVALKKAEASDRLIARFATLGRAAGSVRVGKGDPVALRPGELLTLSLDPRRPADGARRVNLIEDA